MGTDKIQVPDRRFIQRVLVRIARFLFHDILTRIFGAQVAKGLGQFLTNFTCYNFTVFPTKFRLEFDRAVASETWRFFS